MQLYYQDVKPLIYTQKQVFVPLKNFFLNMEHILEPDTIRVGAVFNSSSVCLDKVCLNGEFYLVFSKFEPHSEFIVDRQGFTLAIITLSDKGYSNLRKDKSGPQIESMVEPILPLSWVKNYILPDNFSSLKYLLIHLAQFLGVDIIITTGGTGVYPRDITPEATLEVIEKRLPGFEQAMLFTSLQKTPHAVLSRAICGICKKTLILNLPGSPKAVRENLESILPALKHCLEKIHGDPTECGS
ncbi:MogA/MoaB family molybdenum cofactor biosynthesis protein [Desulfonauticus submarinus]